MAVYGACNTAAVHVCNELLLMDYVGMSELLWHALPALSCEVACSTAIRYYVLTHIYALR
jgi:hypothetical protein